MSLPPPPQCVAHTPHPPHPLYLCVCTVLFGVEGEDGGKAADDEQSNARAFVAGWERKEVE